MRHIWELSKGKKETKSNKNDVVLEGSWPMWLYYRAYTYKWGASLFPPRLISCVYVFLIQFFSICTRKNKKIEMTNHWHAIHFWLDSRSFSVEELRREPFSWKIACSENEEERFLSTKNQAKWTLTQAQRDAQLTFGELISLAGSFVSYSSNFPIL